MASREIMQVSRHFCLLSSKKYLRLSKTLYYYYGMTRAAFINIFKNHVNICGKNFAAYADAALVR